MPTDKTSEDYQNHRDEICMLYRFITKEEVIPESFIEELNKCDDVSLIIPKFFYWLLSDKEDGLIRCVETKITNKAVLDTSSALKKQIDAKVISYQSWEGGCYEDYKTIGYSNNAGINASLIADKLIWDIADIINECFGRDILPLLKSDNMSYIISTSIEVRAWHYAAFADCYKETYNSSWEATEAAQDVARYCPVREEAYRAYAEKLLEILRST